MGSAPSPPCGAATAARWRSSPSRRAAGSSPRTPVPSPSASRCRAGRRTAAPGRRASRRSRRSGRCTSRCASPRGAAQPRPAPAVRRQPAALRHLGRHRARRGLGQLGAGPARRRGPDGRAARGGPGHRPCRPRGCRRRGRRASTPGCATTQPRVTWPGGQFASGRLPAGHPLVGEVADAVEVADRRPAGRGGRALRLRPAALRRTSAASRRCTTAPVTCGWRTPRGSRCRSPRSSHVARALALLAARRLGAH